MNPEASRRLAAELRAGQYVTGDLLENVGSSSAERVSARHESPGRSVSTGERRGVDGADLRPPGRSRGRSARRLPVGRIRTTRRPRDPDERLPGSDQGVPAGRADDAGGPVPRGGRRVDRATQLDTSFALAYYRKSIAADWIDAFDIRSSADRAFQYSDRLSERDRGLLNALRLRRNGRVVEAEKAFRTQLHVYPDDVEALVQLGEALFHDQERRGRSIMESAVPFERALQLEPTNLIALIHLARVYALTESTEKLAETARILAEIAPESERALEVESLYAHVLADTARQSSIDQRMLGKPWYYRIYATLGVDRFARNARAAERILDERESDEPLLVAMIPIVQIEQGRLEEARAFFEQPRLSDIPSWNVFEASVLTSGLLPPDEQRMTELAARLEDLDPNDLLASFWLPPYEDMTPGFAAFMRDFYRTLLLVQLGRIPEARLLLDDMIGREPFIGLGTFKPDAERILESEILMQAGDRQQALEVLRTVEYQVPHAVTVMPMPDQARSRILRSELEREIGNIETSRGFLLGLDESWSPWDGMYRSSVYRMLGEIAEDEGRYQDAVLNFTRLLNLWEECDPDLVPIRDGIEERRNALVREIG